MGFGTLVHKEFGGLMAASQKLPICKSEIKAITLHVNFSSSQKPFLTRSSLVIVPHTYVDLATPVPAFHKC